MDMVNMPLKWEKNIKDFFRMVKEKEKENYFFLMENFMKENLKKDKCKLKNFSKLLNLKLLNKK